MRGSPNRHPSAGLSPGEGGEPAFSVEGKEGFP